MRQIKFRVYDRITKSYGGGNLWMIAADGTLYYGNAEWKEGVVELFAEKYDIDGTEVYEGDVVKTKYNAIVVIKRAGARITPYRNKNGVYNKVTNWGCVENGKVIGNIHDNPELLEVQND